MANDGADDGASWGNNGYDGGAAQLQVFALTQDTDGGAKDKARKQQVVIKQSLACYCCHR